MDSVQRIDKKDGFLRLIVFTIVKITSTDKEIQLYKYGFVGKITTRPSSFKTHK
jgi:hypothetical protein